MTSPWVIFFRTYLLLCLLAPAGQLAAAAVLGHVDLTDSNDSSVKKRRNFAGIVVWLQPSQDASGYFPKKHVAMLQKNKMFTPHILAIGTGTSVDFPNLDPIFHNAFSNFDGKIFDIGLYPPGTSKSVRFDRPGIVRVFCNIHPSMSAIIVVLNTPYFAITQSDGSFAMPNVPPGTYELHFFHERATPETLDKVARRIAVAQQVTELPPITISETGYLPIDHKNKYGRDYPAGADEQRAYPSPLK